MLKCRPSNLCDNLIWSTSNFSEVIRGCLGRAPFLIQPPIKYIHNFNLILHFDIFMNLGEDTRYIYFI